MFKSLLLFPIIFLVPMVLSSQSLDARIDQVLYDIIGDDSSYCAQMDTLRSICSDCNDYYIIQALSALCATFDSDEIKAFLEWPDGVIDKRALAYKDAVEGYWNAENGFYDKGLQQLLKSLDGLEQTKDKHFIALVHVSIGVYYYSNQIYDLGIQYLELSLKAGQELSDRDLIIESLDWLGSAYSRAGHQQKSDSTMKIYDDYVRQDTTSDVYFYGLCNNGFYWDNHSNFDSATYYFQQAHNWALRFNDSSAWAESLVYWAEIKYKVQEYESCIQMMKQYHALPYRFQRIPLDIRGYEGIWRSSAALGDFEQAHIYADSLYAVDSEYWDITTKEQTLAMEAQYQSAKKDAEIARQRLALVKSKTQRNAIGLGGLGLFILLGFILRINHKNKRLAAAEMDNLLKQQQLANLDFMMMGQEEERKRIARDLHDGLGSLLSTAHRQIKSVQNEITKLKNINTVQNAEKLIDNACNEVRRIAHDMMPSALINLGLSDAIEDLSAQLTTEYAINTTVNIRIKTDLSENQQINIYRIVQEIINNIIKHAEASSVTIRIDTKNESMHIAIIDNGKGFDTSKSLPYESGIGLKNIKTRINYLKGDYTLSSTPGRGTQFQIKIPLDR